MLANNERNHNKDRLPRAPLPSPICSNKPGTWAYDTLTRRIRTDILARVWRENDFFDAETIKSLQALSDELEAADSCVLTPIPNDGGPDWETWNAIMSSYIGKYTWLTAPYCLVEFYFYRRLMAAVHWFRDRRDPFRHQKELGVQSSVNTMFSLLRRLKGVSSVQNNEERGKLEMLSFLFLSLWGNRLDLSLWPTLQGTSSQTNSNSNRELIQFVERTTTESDKLLADDSEKIFQHLYLSLIKEQPLKKSRRRVDIIVDNAGLELFCDMCLAHYLIQSGMSDEILFHLKAHPLFVSDAMEKDFLYTIDYLEEMSRDKPELLSILSQWREYLEKGQWRTKEDYFWCQPCAFWEMPDSIGHNMKDHSLLVVVKGDANYRRLLGDLDWEKTTRFEDIVNYFPAPVCALRTLKSEILCGVTKEKIEYAQLKDSKWMVSGEWAVVQFYQGN